MELTKQDIEEIRNRLRTSGDANLVPLGHNLTDAEIQKLGRWFRNSVWYRSGDQAKLDSIETHFGETL